MATPAFIRVGIFAGSALVLGCFESRPALADDLRVCADPNNLPFSNAQGDGFENKLAELAARELGKKVSYTWWAQRRGFVRNTLNAKLCDVIIGVPSHYDLVETTRSYYRSSYVLVSRVDRGLEMSSLKDPRLRELKIGVQLVGDDGMNTPPVHALGQQGVVGNVVGYTIYGDYALPTPPMRLIEAVETGQVDVAAAWGPLAGYAASHSPVPLRIAMIDADEEFAPLRFAFDISMGVRKGDHALKQRLDDVISSRRDEIRALLESYAIPLLSDERGAAPE